MKKIFKLFTIFVLIALLFTNSACTNDKTDEVSIKTITTSVSQVDGQSVIHFVIEMSNGEKLSKDEVLTVDGQSITSVDASIVEHDGNKYWSYVIELDDGKTISKEEPYHESDVTVTNVQTSIIERDGKYFWHFEFILSDGQTITKDEPYESISTPVVSVSLKEALDNTTNYKMVFTSYEDEELFDSITYSANGGIIKFTYTTMLGDTYTDYLDTLNRYYYSDYSDEYYKVSFDEDVFLDLCYADFYGLNFIDDEKFELGENGLYICKADYLNEVGKAFLYDYDDDTASEVLTYISIEVEKGYISQIIARSTYTTTHETSECEYVLDFSRYGSISSINLPEAILVTDENYNDIFDDGNQYSPIASSIIIEDVASDLGWINGTQYKSFSYDGITFDVECTPYNGYSENSGKYYTNGENWRLYGNENATLTISADRTISSVYIYYESVKDGVLTYEGREYEAGAGIEVNDTSLVLSISVGQARITEINVYFEEEVEYYEELYEGIPRSGDVKVLVIPVQFTDDAFSSSELEDLALAFSGTNQETGWESLQSYYYKSSFGKLNIIPVIQEVYNANMSSKDFSRDYKAYNFDYTNTVANPLDTLLDAYFSNANINLNDYDANDDGLVDGVYLVYSAPYSSSGSDSDVYWAWTDISLSEVNYSNTEEELYLGYYVWMSIDFLYDAIDFGKAEEEDIYIDVNAQTIIHETGHMLGLDDYYDFDDTVGPDGGLGCADMMDYNCGDHNAVSKIILGWIGEDHIHYVSSTETVTISSQSLSGDCIIITKDNTSSLDQEYILIELYTTGEELTGITDGRWGYPSVNALRIYHVDGTKTTEYESTFLFEVFKYDNGVTDHKFISIVEADGNDSIEETGMASDADYFLAGSSLVGFKWYDGSSASFTISIDSIDGENKLATVSIAFN